MSATKHRSIKQMVGAGGKDGALDIRAYALCDDGTVWMLLEDPVHLKRMWAPVDVFAVEFGDLGR